MGEDQPRSHEFAGGDAASKPVVLHVIYALEHGGTERFLCRLLNRLAGDGMRHVVCTLRAAGERAAELDRRVAVEALGLAERSHWGFLQLGRVLRRLQPAIIHARNPGTWTDVLLARRFHRHARVVLGFHGLQTHLGFSPSQRLRFRMLGAARHALTAVSHAGKDLLVRDLGCDATAVHVLGNGVDADRYRPPSIEQRVAARARWGVGAHEFAIGNVGNMFAEVKGHAVLIDAAARLMQQRGNVRLLLAGFGPLADALRAQALRLGIEERVQLLGAVEQPADMLAALDLYVCPSLAEGMSNALLEAMACALPCVGTDVGDHHRMFNRLGAADLLVPPGDGAALAVAIGRLIDDEGRRLAVGDAARRCVERDHPLEQAIAGYARFYRSLLPDSPANPIEPVEAARCLS